MASGALPPAFPAVRIDGELYWDGGILSNTPVEAVFDDKPRRNSLVFAVHVWNPGGPEPETIREVLNRQKDVQYSSRAVSHIRRQKQIHRLRHIIAELAMRLPESERESNLVHEMASYGCLTRMHVVRLLAPPARRRGSHQGYRLQPQRYPLAVGGWPWRCAPGARKRAVGSKGRSDRGLLPSRMPPGDRADGMNAPS
jgi:NTE family protein